MAVVPVFERSHRASVVYTLLSPGCHCCGVCEAPCQAVAIQWTVGWGAAVTTCYLISLLGIQDSFVVALDQRGHVGHAAITDLHFGAVEHASISVFRWEVSVKKP